MLFIKTVVLTAMPVTLVKQKELLIQELKNMKETLKKIPLNMMLFLNTVLQHHIESIGKMFKFSIVKLIMTVVVFPKCFILEQIKHFKVIYHSI